MPDTPSRSHSVTLALSHKEQWILHHVLLDRIEEEATAGDSMSADPPPVTVFQAFETLDAGETNFTIIQLNAMQPILAKYHHSKGWENDRSELEQLLHRVTKRIDQRETSRVADRYPRE